MVGAFVCRLLVRGVSNADFLSGCSVQISIPALSSNRAALTLPLDRIPRVRVICFSSSFWRRTLRATPLPAV